MTDNNKKWTGYFKIVTPSPSKVKMTDSQNLNDMGGYNNYTWYQRLVQGSASRLTRYREYDLMDNDVEVARALDTMAEEMTGNNPKTDEPIEIDILTEDEDVIKSSTVLTVKAALRRWGEIHDWDERLYHVSRLMMKYGDIFFRKTKSGGKWQFIHPKNVIAAVVDSEDATQVLAWQIKSDINKPRSSAYSQPMGTNPVDKIDSELVSSNEIVRFTLNHDMSDTAPFGESVLRSVYRSHKQKELLEDAIIIYRVQRAPERRVFYIDVGKMPPHRTKQYLETIKNEIKQKKIPNINGGQMEVDSVYNPQSMCLDLNTKIPLLDGRTLTLQELISEHKKGKENWVYSIDPNTGEVVPGPISWAGVTQKNVKTIKLILDNGEEIVCTPEHKFPIQGKGFIEAQHITPEDSMWPFKYEKEHMTTPVGKTAGQYAKIYNPNSKGWKYVHRIVANYMKHLNEHNEFEYDSQYIGMDKKTIHHKNYASIDNTPSNLVWMNSADHSKFHLEMNPNQEAVFPTEMVSRFVELANRDIYIKFKDLMELLNSDELFMLSYVNANIPKKGTKYKLKTDMFRQKMFLVFIKNMGFKNWKEYQQYIIQSYIDIPTVVQQNRVHNEHDIGLLQHVLHLIKTIGIHNFKLVNHLKKNIQDWEVFRIKYENVFDSKFNNRSKKLSTPEASMFERISKYFGYNNFKHLVLESANFNHRVVKIEQSLEQDVGTLTIDKDEKYHKYHTFALASGVFTRNSEDFFFASRPDGRGSRVESLPGGQGLGELSDLEYFQRKVWRGLKVPASYMIEQQEGGQIWNDGKVGIAYIQELRFALYIARMQTSIERVLDMEFKKYLHNANIKIDEQMYKIRLPDPSNFGKYRQQEIDSNLLSQYGGADGISYLSPRFALKRYLQLSDEEIIRNERMRREELGLDPDGGIEDLPQIYGTAEDMGAVGGVGGGMGAMGLGGGFGGEEMGMLPDGQGAEGAEGAGMGGQPGAAGLSPALQSKVPPS